MDSTTQFLTTIILVSALAFTAIVAPFFRRRRDLYPVRPLPAAETVPLLIGQAVEAGRRVQISSGGAAVGGASTALALASTEVLYQMALRSAASGEAPIAMSGDSTTLPLLIGASRRGYRDAERLSRFSPLSSRWVPTDSLALYAGLVADIGDERALSAVYVGDFNAAIALPLEAIARRRGSSIAGSTQLEGAAAAYALSDAPVLGEELFTLSAYLDERTGGRDSLLVLDLLRWLVIVGLLAATVLALGDPISRALGGG